MSEASPNIEQIERELVNLGEAPPSEAELALLRSSDPADDADVASVARLSELAEPHDFEDLSELETHRVWRSVEQRLSTAEGGDEPGAAPAARGGGSRNLLFMVLGLAAAAVLLLMVQPLIDSEGGSDEVDGVAQGSAPSAEEVAALGDQVRSSLRELDDGKSDSERAAELAADYQRQLEEQGG